LASSFLPIPARAALGLVVRQLVSKWPARWPRSPKVVFKAGRWVDDVVVYR
jgi:hypothetical protein